MSRVRVRAKFGWRIMLRCDDLDFDIRLLVRKSNLGVMISLEYELEPRSPIKIGKKISKFVVIAPHTEATKQSFLLASFSGDVTSAQKQTYTSSNKSTPKAGKSLFARAM